LHPWLKQVLTDKLNALPEPTTHLDPQANRQLWESWLEGLSERPFLPNELPPL